MGKSTIIASNFQHFLVIKGTDRQKIKKDIEKLNTFDQPIDFAKLSTQK